MMVRKWGPWAVVFLVLSGIALSGAAVGLDRQVAAWLRPWGSAWPQLNLIWVFGGIPLTTAAVLWVSFRRGWGYLLLFGAGMVIEVVCKHWIGTPMPTATPEPSFYRHLENWFNISPSTAMSWVDWVLGRSALASSTHHFLRGSFPSGHTFRITFTLGAITGAKRWAILGGAGLVTAVLVVATGGHWILDAAGGFALAFTGLTFLQPRSRRAR